MRQGFIFSVGGGWVIVLKINMYSQFYIVQENLRSKCKRPSPSWKETLLSVSSARGICTYSKDARLG